MEPGKIKELGLDKIRYKEAGNDWFIKIFLDENENEIERTPSFADGKGCGTGLYAEMKVWEANGWVIEPQYTDEELAEKKTQTKIDLYNILKSEKKHRLLEADKWELPSILILIDKTIDDVISYKQQLRDMTEIVTIDSDISILESPPWPEKLTDKEFL